jgi:hypothetical protein
MLDNFITVIYKIDKHDICSTIFTRSRAVSFVAVGDGVWSILGVRKIVTKNYLRKYYSFRLCFHGKIPSRGVFECLYTFAQRKLRAAGFA